MKKSCSTAMLLSMRSQFAERVFNGDKTVELRKTRPRRIGKGSIVYVYVSSPVQSIVGYFRVRGVVTGPVNRLKKRVLTQASVTAEEFGNYFGDNPRGTAIYLEEATKLNEPISLSAVRALQAGFRPPQSYRYLAHGDIPLVSG